MSTSTILVVEDEPIVAIDLEQRLTRLGYEVVGIVPSAEGAIQKAAELGPDIVLMDIRLQGEMDGIDAAEQIHRSTDTPIIFLTAFADERTIRRVKADEPAGYLLKPFDERELEVALVAALHRRQTMRRIRAGEEWLATILRGIAGAVIAADADGKIGYMNPVAEQLTGWSRNEALGRAVEEVLRTRGDAARAAPATARVFRETLLDRRGLERAVEIESTPIRVNERASGAVWVFRDVTERERIQGAQRLLIEAGALLACSFDGSLPLEKVTRLIVDILAEWCVVDLIEAERRVLCCAAVAHAHPEQERALRALLLGRERPWDSDDPGARAARSGRAAIHDGSADLAQLCRNLGVDPASLPPGAGARSVLCVPLIARDRTLGAMTFVAAPSKRRYDEFDLDLAESLALRFGTVIDNFQLYERAQRAVRMRDDALAVVSHDLKSPLTALSLAGDLLLRSPELASPTAERPRKQALAIRRAVQHMNQLVGDLLDAARIDAGKLSIEQREWAAADLVREACETFELLAQEKSVRIVARQAPGDLPIAIFCDHDRVLQIFSNLLTNAIKFSPAGAEVEIRVEVTTSREARFAITDAGPGISKDVLPHIFQRRWQGPGASKSGSGLGLYIAEAIARAHGGRIWVESVPGHGSTFFFTLPVAEPGGARAG